MRLRFLFAGLLALLFFVPTAGFSQFCTPDPSYTASGLYPDSLPPACVGIPYSSNITVVVPIDTFLTSPIPITLPIDSVVLVDVIGLPAGFSFNCHNSTCAVYGGTSGCIELTGTPTAPDTIDLEVAVVLHVQFLTGPISVPDTVAGLFTLYINPGFTTSVNSTDASCGASDGTASVAASGGSGSFTYAWSNGATTASVTGLAAGTYTVVTTDASGCTKTDTVTIATNGANPTVSIDAAYWEGCASTGGGVITVSATGGDGSYNYTWSNGATTDSVGGLPGGTYSVTVTDGLGCSDQESVTITQPSELTLSAAAENDLSCYADNSGLITVGATGGSGAYSYAWTGLPNENGPTIDNLAAGTYDVVVEDEAGCQKTLSFTLDQPDSLDIAVTFTGETAFNQQDGTAKAVVSGGTSPYTYSWDSGATADSIGDLAPGTYVLTVTDANSCEKMVQVEIPAVAQSIGKASGILALSISPNPSHGMVEINWELSAGQQASLRLRDLRGALISDWGTVQASGSLRKELQLPAGLYVIEMTTEKGIGYQKLIVQ